MDHSTQVSQPESNIAQSFSEELQDVFGINQPLGVLAKKVEAKKREVSSQSEELAAIESRLRETEARLARVQGSAPSPPTTDNVAANAAPAVPVRSLHQGSKAVASAAPVPVQPAPAMNQNVEAALHPKPPLNSRQDSLGLPPIPGAMPITPLEQSRNEYMVHGQGR